MKHTPIGHVVLVMVVVFSLLWLHAEPVFAVPSAMVNLPMGSMDRPQQVVTRGVVPEGYSLQLFVPALRAEDSPPANFVLVRATLLTESDVASYLPGEYAGDQVILRVTREADGQQSHFMVPSLDAPGGINGAGTDDDGQQATPYVDDDSITFLVNDPPIAYDDTLTIRENNDGIGTLQAVDWENDALTYTLVTQGSKGTVAVNAANGAYIYTPEPNATGSDAFTFKADDGRVDSPVATISIIIQEEHAMVSLPMGSMDQPQQVVRRGVVPEGYSLRLFVPALRHEDNPPKKIILVRATLLTESDVTGYLPGEYAGDQVILRVTRDTDGQQSHFIVPSLDAPGGINGAGKDDDGQQAATYVNDGSLTFITNEPPVAYDGTLTIHEHAEGRGTLPATDLDDDALTYSIVAQSSKGTASVNSATGRFTYTPNVGANGLDAFAFRVHDGTTGSNTATFSLTIQEQNDPPTIRGVPPTWVAPGQHYSFTPTANDMEDNTLTFSIQGKPDWAQFSVTDGTLSGTPSISDYGSHTVTLSVTDGLSDPVFLPSFDLQVVDNQAPTVNGNLVAGAYSSHQTITLICNDQGSACKAIHYTLDGSEPTTSSPLYADPIRIETSMTLQYIAVDNANNIGPVQSQTYTIDTTAPQITLRDLQDGQFVKYLDEISGTVSDPETGVRSFRIQIGRDDGKTLELQENGVWYWTMEDTWLAPREVVPGTKTVDWNMLISAYLLRNGATYAIHAEATDVVQNLATVSLSLTYSDKSSITGLVSLVADEGGAPLAGVAITLASDGYDPSLTLLSGENGRFDYGLDADWSGTITPVKQGYVFDPLSHTVEKAELAIFPFDFKATKVVSEADARAIIVAGGGDPADYLWYATNSTANFAYRTLRYKGILRDNIRYFNAQGDQDVDGDGDVGNDIFGPPTVAAIESAIKDWAGSYVNAKKPLLIYMVDHGGLDTFYVSKPVGGVAETLLAAQLDGWLDALQEQTGAKVIVIYDACFAGSFLNDLRPPPGSKRINIMSTGINQLASFASGGSLSFSDFFWKHVLQGSDLRRSFDKSRRDIRYATNQVQSPIFDADGDGEWHAKQEGSLLADIYLGNPFATAAVFPEIVETISDIYMEEGTSHPLWARLQQKPSVIDKVWVVVMPPGTGEIGEEPIADRDLPEPIPLTYNQDRGRYEGSFAPITHGRYVLNFYAQANDSERWKSLPAIATVHVGHDRFENDDSAEHATIITLNDNRPQHHNFHQTGDEDWVRFYAVAGEIYEIMVDNAGSSADVTLSLYRSNDGLVLIDEVDDNYGGERELLIWRATHDGMYYVKVTNWIPEATGYGTEYDLRVYRPEAPLIGFVTGTVRQGLTGEGIGGALIRSAQGASAITVPGGAFIMAHRSGGPYDLTATAPGYQNVAGSVTVEELGIANLDMDMFPEGTVLTDGDGDGILDGSDNCPTIGNPGQSNFDDDGQGDACDGDDDNDGVLDDQDAFPLNAQESVDYDQDGLGDNADTDDDNDGVLDSEDDYPLDASRWQAVDNTDSDSDGIPDHADNCPTIPNPDASDFDDDGAGDACDDDDDNDGISDREDLYPLDAGRWFVETSISGTITGGSSGEVFVNIWSERTQHWDGQTIELEADGSTDFTLSGLPKAVDYRLDWSSEQFASGYYSALTNGPVSRREATLLNTQGSLSGIQIFLTADTKLAITVIGLQEGDTVHAGLWSDTLDLGGWSEAQASAAGIATLIIQGLNATGTDYRLFIHTASGNYAAGHYKGEPTQTFDTDLSDGDSTWMTAGTLVDWKQATLIDMAYNLSVKVAMTAGGTISGTVSGLSGGQSAWVDAFSERTHGWGGLSITADADGNAPYSLKGLKRARDYRVGIEGAGVQGGFYSGGSTLVPWPQAAKVDIKTVPDGKENGDAMGIDLVVSEGVSISGSVHGLQPGEWAWLDAWSDATFSWSGTMVKTGTETGGSGVPFTLDGLARAADYELSLNAEGYVRQRKAGVDATTSVTGMEFTLFTGGKISGSIRGLSTFGFVWVDAFSPKTGAWGGVGVVADASGTITYTVDGLPEASDYVVALQTDGKTFFYRMEGLTPVWRQHDAVTVTVGTTEDIDFNLDAATNMMFKLSGTVTMNPVSEDQVVEIMVWSEDGVGARVSQIGGGAFTLKGLPAGHYKIEVFADGYAPKRVKTATISSGSIDSSTLAWTQGWNDMGTLDLTTDTTGLDVTLSAGLTLSGTVKDASGAVLPGVWVSAWNNTRAIGSGAETNVSGSYTIEGLSATSGEETYTVEVWTASGTVSKPLPLTADATLDLQIAAKALGGISGLVLNSSKIAQSRALVLIYDDSGTQVAATATDGTGAFKVEGLTPDKRYTVKVFGDDSLSTTYAYAEVAVSVVESTYDAGTLELTAPSGS